MSKIDRPTTNIGYRLKRLEDIRDRHIRIIQTRFAVSGCEVTIAKAVRSGKVKLRTLTEIRNLALEDVGKDRYDRKNYGVAFFNTDKIRRDHKELEETASKNIEERIAKVREAFRKFCDIACVTDKIEEARSAFRDFEAMSFV